MSQGKMSLRDMNRQINEVGMMNQSLRAENMILKEELKNAKLQLKKDAVMEMFFTAALNGACANASLTSYDVSNVGQIREDVPKRVAKYAFDCTVAMLEHIESQMPSPPDEEPKEQEHEPQDSEQVADADSESGLILQP